MKEKEARAKFRQVWKVVFNFVLLMFLVEYNGQYSKLDFRVHGILKSALLYFLKNGKLEKKCVLPEFKFKTVAYGYF